jgi:SAM-dependent methyltransferase
MIGRLKRIARSGASSVVHLAMDSARLRALVSADLKARRPPPTADLVVPAGDFIDRFGVRHPLDLGLRDRLKPGWRIMCDEETSAQPPTDDAMRIRARKAERSVAEASALVATAAGARLSGRVLEIGCYDGSVAFQLAKRDGMEVVASDMARYYIVQRPGDPDATDLGGQQEDLALLRERARVAADAAVGSVRFVEDDITSSSLEPATFDAIVSFEVLEHVQDPARAFASMARLLKPGGIGYHDYNPFFSLIGGHSL